MGRILIVDTETGGVGTDAHQKYSILQLAALVYIDGKIIPNNDFDVLIREPVLVAQPEALQINGITPERLLSEGIPPEKAVEKFLKWLRGVGYEGAIYGTEKIILGGHNVGYDAGFISRLFRLGGCEEYYEKLFSHRMIDTASIARFLILAGLLPEKTDGSRSLFEHFGCEPSRPHDAFSDALATVQLLDRMISLVRNNVLNLKQWDPSEGSQQSVSELEKSILDKAESFEPRTVPGCPSCSPFPSLIKKY